MLPCSGVRVFCLALALAGLAGAVHPAQAGRAESADTLYQKALRDIRRDSFDLRRRAAKYLERATLLAPDSVGFHLELARLYFSMGFLGQARHRYERVTALMPNLAEAHLGQGLTWRRDYLKYLERGSLRRALEELHEAARLAPAWAEPWLQLVPLLVEDARLPEAMTAAERAQAADPGRPDGVLAIAHLSYRLGQIERADSAFRAALPRLPHVVLDKFHDIAPVASERDTVMLRRLPPSERMAYVLRFWKHNDPDPTTPENEAQLEYWSRVTQAYFLFFHRRRQLWDQRGEMYVRYGPPDKAVYNPVGAHLWFHMGTYGNFPMNVLVWNYPGLGMTVPMHDRLLSEYYLPPVSVLRSTDPAPDPDSLARRDGSLATAGGRGVFSVYPPGTRPLPVDAVLARFEGEEMPRLLAWLESPGGPGDSLWGEWVVLDSTAVEVARVGRSLSASACDPAGLRAAEFAADLPPGEYIAGLSVRASGPGDAARRRGIFRAAVRLGPPNPALELSDVVVSCGTPEPGMTSGGTPAVRLTASPGARIDGAEPLTVYFETYHLRPGPDGISRFEYEYTVRSAERDPRIWIQRLISPRRGIPEVSAVRREEQVGDLRRQFVTVPVQPLPAGHYRIEVRVRDLNAGTEAVKTADFVREGVTVGG